MLCFLLLSQILLAAKVTFFIDSECQNPSSFTDAILEIGACNSFSNQPNISLRFQCSTQAALQIYLASNACRGTGTTINFAKDGCSSVTVGTELFYIYSDCASKYGSSGYLGPNSTPSEPTTTPEPTAKPVRSENSSSDSGLSTGAIIGIVIGMVFVVALALLAYKFYLQRDKNLPPPPEPKIIYLPDQRFNNQPSSATIPGPYPQGGYAHNELAEEYPINGNQGYKTMEGYGNGQIHEYQNYGYQQAPVQNYQDEVTSYSNITSNPYNAVDESKEVPDYVNRNSSINAASILEPQSVNPTASASNPRDTVMNTPVSIPAIVPMERNTRDSILSTPVSIPLE